MCAWTEGFLPDRGVPVIRYAVLGSGSNGNSYILEYEGTSILLDAGFSLKQIRERCITAGFDPDLISSLFITHLHPDHARGAGVFARQMKKPVYLHHAIDDSFKDFRNLRIPEELRRTIGTQPVSVGAFTVTYFSTFHDSPFSGGYHVNVGGRNFVLLTDTGKTEASMERYASESDVLFLEANYDEQMLRQGPYPYFLKQRIGGEEGHLSNDISIDFLNGLSHNEERTVYFCHLSLENNSAEVLRRSLEERGLSSIACTICENGQTYAGAIEKGVTSL